MCIRDRNIGRPDPLERHPCAVSRNAALPRNGVSQPERIAPPYKIDCNSCLLYTSQRGAIACEKCAAPIYVYKPKTLPDEFSVRCAHCGGRGIYLKRAIAIEEAPERRKKPRR